MRGLRRFWFQFAGTYDELPPGIVIGCGVTAVDEAQAMYLLREHVFSGAPLPPITNVVRDVDLRTLDEGHVRPNMGNPATVGIWFPLGYARV